MGFAARIISKAKSARVFFQNDYIPTQPSNMTLAIDQLNIENQRLVEMISSLRTTLNHYKLAYSEYKRHQDYSQSLLSQQMVELRKAYEKDMSDYQSSMAAKFQQEAEVSILAVKKNLEIDHSSHVNQIQEEYDSKINSMSETIKRLYDESSSLSAEVASTKSMIEEYSKQLEESKATIASLQTQLSNGSSQIEDASNRSPSKRDSSISAPVIKKISRPARKPGRGTRT